MRFCLYAPPPALLGTTFSALTITSYCLVAVWSSRPVSRSVSQLELMAACAPRSGLAVKHGLDTLAGVIDPDYTGEVKVVLQNLDVNQPFVIRPGYRIAQLILEQCVTPEVVEVPSECTGLVTERGAAGFGSTGM